VDKFCVSKLCVRQAAGGQDGDGAGVQNQKQEPHTKMWGITSSNPPFYRICFAVKV